MADSQIADIKNPLIAGFFDVESLTRGVFSRFPAAGSQMFFSYFQRLGFERRGHAVIPAVEESKQADDTEQLSNLTVAPMLL